MFLHNLNASSITSQYLYITYFSYCPWVLIVLITTDMLSRAGCKKFPILSINTHVQLCPSRTTVEHQICEIWQHGSYGPWRSILFFTKKKKKIKYKIANLVARLKSNSRYIWKCRHLEIWGSSNWHQHPFL